MCTHYDHIVSPILTASVTQSAGQDVALFVVKFDYDPLKMSPNPNPQYELTLTAGRYVYIYGDMDEVCVYVCVSLAIHLRLYAVVVTKLYQPNVIFFAL